VHKLLPLFILLIAVCGFCLTLPQIRQRVISFLPIPANEKIALGSANSSCVDTASLNSPSGEFDTSAQVAYFNDQKVGYSKDLLAQGNNTQEAVLGASDPNGKWIEVSLDDQILRAWDGNQVVDWYAISSGKWAPTVVGTFNIYWKIRYIRMKGGDKVAGDYYDLPNVPDTMFFYEGYGIHGAYWHNNFGHPMSHGCINEPLNKAHWLFEWATPTMAANESSMRATPENPGTKVCIHKGHLVPLSGDPQAQACPARITY